MLSWVATPSILHEILIDVFRKRLELWIERVLTADTAQAVFEDPPTLNEEGSHPT